MTACKITAGLDCASCNEVRTKAGLFNEIYLINVDDIDTEQGNFQGFGFTVGTTGNITITSINLFAYATAYKFCMKKNSGGLTNELQVTEGGYKFWNQTFTGVFIPNDNDSRGVYDQLVGGNFVIVGRDFSSRFWVMGYADGIELTAGTVSSGVAPGDAAGFSFTFSGAVDQLPPQMNLGSYSSTYAYLEGLL